MDLSIKEMNIEDTITLEKQLNLNRKEKDIIQLSLEKVTNIER